MSERLSGSELMALIQRAFHPQPGERALAVLVDLPDAQVVDNTDWADRREIARQWVSELNALGDELKASLVLYRNVHTNNGDLPQQAWFWDARPLPLVAEALDPTQAIPFSQIYETHPILLAPTEFSATAPLKMAAKSFPFRAATMPGFKAEMIPALRIDYTEVNRRVELLKGLLDRATGADFAFGHPGGEDRLHLDLRWRGAHASGGLLPKPGVAGNLPSGEAYIVPYEGEREGEPSRSAGVLPVELDGEVVRFRIEANKALEVLTQGAVSERERDHLRREPAYGNMAELGLGVLAAFGLKPIGEVLLDEKLGLHIAFGRSEHFGGQVGPKAFSSPEAVIHIDRVYVPEVQPQVTVKSVALHFEDGSSLALMRNGQYAIDFK